MKLRQFHAPRPAGAECACAGGSSSRRSMKLASGAGIHESARRALLLPLLFFSFRAFAFALPFGSSTWAGAGGEGGESQMLGAAVGETSGSGSR